MLMSVRRDAAGNPAPPDDVRAMFDRIAPIYDAMNTVMTAGMDARWRAAAVRAAAVRRGGLVVDVACGSGALTRALAREVTPGGEAIGVDRSLGMLRQARRRRTPAGAVAPRYITGNALRLPLDDAIADAVTVAFGLRNVPDYAACLAEMIRVARFGGHVVVLELASPEGGMGRALAATWFERVVPLLGRLAGGGSAYRYLPDSVHAYPPPEAIADLMRAGGLAPVRWRRLAPGLVTLHVGRRG